MKSTNPLKLTTLVLVLMIAFPVLTYALEERVNLDLTDFTELGYDPRDDIWPEIDENRVGIVEYNSGIWMQTPIFEYYDTCDLIIIPKLLSQRDLLIEETTAQEAEIKRLKLANVGNVIKFSLGSLVLGTVGGMVFTLGAMQ